MCGNYDIVDHLNYYLTQYGWQSKETRLTSQRRDPKLSTQQNFTRKTRRDVFSGQISQQAKPSPKYEHANYCSKESSAFLIF